MADATIKPDSGNDLILSNDDGSAKIEVNEGGDVEITPSTSLKVTLGSDSGDDFNVDSGRLVVKGKSGSVGVGITPKEVDTNYKALQVAGTAGLQGTATQGAGSIVALTNNVYRATDQTWKYLVADEASRYDQFDGTHVFRVATTGSAPDDTISFSDALTIANNKNVTINDGDLVIGTAGHGIDFSVNSHASGMTSEVLDSYEEGTWVPVFETNGAGPTYNTTGANKLVNGIYTKIGDQVIARFVGNINVTIGPGSMTALDTVSLPFTPKSETLYAYAVGGYVIKSMNTNEEVLGFNNHNPASGSRIYFMNRSSGAGAAIQTGSYGGVIICRV